jgi:hypothetical protein
MLVAARHHDTNMPLFEQFGRPPMYVQQHGLSQFGGLKRTSGMDVQSYLNKGQWVAPASEQVWALDLRHYNQAPGWGRVAVRDLESDLFVGLGDNSGLQDRQRWSLRQGAAISVMGGSESVEGHERAELRDHGRGRMAILCSIEGR